MINKIAIKAAEYWNHVDQAEKAMKELRKLVADSDKKEIAKPTQEERKEARNQRKLEVESLVDAGFKWDAFGSSNCELGVMTVDQVLDHLSMTGVTKQEAGYVRSAIKKRNMSIEIDMEGEKMLMVPVYGVSPARWSLYPSQP